MPAISHAFHRSFDELPEWNDVARIGGLYARAELCRAFLDQPTLIAVREDGELVAVAIAMISPRPGSLSRFHEPGFVFGADTAELHPVLYCGVPVGYSTRLLISSRVTSDVRAAVLSEIVAAARELADKHGAPMIMFGLVPEADARELVAVAGPHASTAYGAAQSLVGPVESWDSYLRSTHVRAHAEFRRFTESGLRVQSHSLSDVRDRAVDVLLEHEQKFDPTVTVESLRDEMNRYESIADRSRVLCIWQGDELIGASMAIEHDGVAYVRWAATRNDVPPKANVYFSLAYYIPIRDSLERGISRFDFGVGPLEVKLRRGARARALWYVLVPRDPLPAARRDQLRSAAGARFQRDLELVRTLRPDDVVADLGYGGELTATTA